MPPSGAPPTRPPNSYRDSALAIFALLLAFRIVNALTLRTFFQPDEYFQSLEPAWQLVFGNTSRAWITWVNAVSNLTPRLLHGYLSYHASRSGERNCARPCIQLFSLPSIDSRRIWQTSVA
jgi:hypothetical protein